MNLPSISTYKDKKLDITAAQMYLSDTNLMLLDRQNPGQAYRYDLTKGQVVEEWVNFNLYLVRQRHKKDSFDLSREKI